MENCCRLPTMPQDFESGIYWDELADRCGKISRAVGFKGNTVCTYKRNVPNNEKVW